MGFGSILNLFKQDNWSAKLVSGVDEMLELGAAMFAYTMGLIVEGTENGEAQRMIYDKDQRINDIQRRIRRHVVAHLSVQGSRGDVPSALIFMNVVKDAERLGDYIKNLYEVKHMLPADVDRKLYQSYLALPSAEIAAMFQLTREAFDESDEELAGKVIKRARVQGKNFEKTIREITKSDLGTNDAVCIVLTLRFLKRLAAHMSNIASTVVMPVDLIDFHDEPEDLSDRG